MSREPGSGGVAALGLDPATAAHARLPQPGFQKNIEASALPKPDKVMASWVVKMLLVRKSEIN